MGYTRKRRPRLVKPPSDAALRAEFSDEIAVAWLAGLIEGEGCFSYGVSPGIRVGMTDRDVVDRVSAILGRNHVRGPYRYRANKKPVFYTEVWGADAIAWMRRLLPHMGERRSKKIGTILERWVAAPGKHHALGTGRATECHPEETHYADGKCRSCYRKKRWACGLPR